MAGRIDVEYPTVVLVGLLCCVLVGLVVGLSTSTVALGPYNYGWDGGSDLRSQLGAGGTEVDVVTSTGAYTGSDPSETVAVVVDPAEPYEGVDAARLSLFVSQGGTILVASADNGTNGLLAGLGTTARIDGRQVRDERTNYREPGLPQANNVSGHRLVRDVDALTLNNGTGLAPGDATVLVNTSALAYLDEGNGELDENDTLGAQPVATVEQVGAGQVVVVSDGSVFTNAMLDREGNRQFVRNLAADHERALIDYSHRGPLPPLTYALVTVRATPVAQFLLGLAGLGLLALWQYGAPVARLRDLAARVRTAPVGAEADGETVAAYLAARHPDWDPERVQRVTKVIRRQRRQEGDNG